MTTYSKISVIGLGYIGLPTAAVFAARKIQVIGVDVNETVVETINRGEIHIVEPDLDILVRSTVSEGFLTATSETESAEAFLIAVPTPLKGANNEPDLNYIEAAAKMIAPVLEVGNLVVLESTSPVGTTEKVAEWLAKARPDLTFPHTFGEESDIRIAHCPERVLPGRVMQELIENDRVIGGLTQKCSEAAASLYRAVVKGECALTDARTAEMSKLTENSFRDVNIAFANELSIICDDLGIDVWELILLANRHPRVNILQPGPGVGGHCIAVDPWFIVSKTPELARIIRISREVNSKKPEWVVGKIEAAIDAFLAANLDQTSSMVSVALYGLAFKPNIDDLRESPAVEIALELLQRHTGTIFVVEPNIQELPANLKSFELVSIDTAMEHACVHVLLVDHHQFICDEYANFSPAFLVDTRGVWRMSKS